MTDINQQTAAPFLIVQDNHCIIALPADEKAQQIKESMKYETLQTQKPMVDWKPKKNVSDVGLLTYDFEWITKI